ncbi:MAG: AAA family ATPase [Burkholderiales bacterium]|nr:AAA family ATPase [Burkholderiales bacterium]
MQKCAGCGFDCGPNAKFCGGCGASLARLTTSSAIAARPAPIAASPSSGWGELKQATVLFADIVSSTEQIAQLGPEEAMDRLQPAVMLMCEAIERFGGTVMRTLGDGVMALFGAPKALEGHARLACEAALHMRSAFGSNEQGLGIRVGLHSGLVASDPYAADGSKGGGAHGVTIHLASRVAALAAPGEIALTADCRALVSEDVMTRSLGLPSLKGIPVAIEIFALNGFHQEAASPHFHEAKLTPFRGREIELSLLQERQFAAEKGQGQVIGISGAPGTGKSRLCYEFSKWCRDRRVPVLNIRAQLYGHATPLQPALELLRTFIFEISASIDAAAARVRVADRLAGAGDFSSADHGLIFEFLGVASQEPFVSQLNPKARRARLLQIVKQLFAKAAARHVILIVEDLHWLDEASEEFVSVLIDAAAGSRVLLILNYRSSYLLPWAQVPHFRQMDLAELSAEETQAMVQELVSSRRELSEIYKLIARRSGGNPFFAEELVRSLAESGALAGDATSPKREISSIDQALPSTVQAVIGARIDRLSEEEKSLLHTCAIVGKEVPVAVLAKVATTSPHEMDRLLERLCRAELIQPQPNEGGRRFAFRHPLIQEVAYGTQLKARRNSIHALVASAMVDFYSERLDEYSALIAHHYGAAGRWVLAATYEATAAQWIGATDSAQAIKHWHRVRDWLNEDSVPTSEGSRLRVMANSKISWLGWRQGLTIKEVQPFIDEALALAGKVDARLTQLLLMVEGRILQACGHTADHYVERVIRALSLLRPELDQGRSVTLNAALSQAYGWAGLLDKALAANDTALSDIQHVDKFDLEFIGFSIEEWVLAMRGRLLTRLGRFDEAHHCLDKLVEMGASSFDPVIVQMPHYAYIELAWHRNDLALANVHLAKATEIAQRHETPYLRVFALSGKGLVASLQEDFQAEAKALGEALSLVRNANVAMEFETEILANLADSHRKAGDLELALAVSKETVRLSRQRGNRLPECRATITWATILSADPRMGAKGEADKLFAEAHALVRSTGAQSYQKPLLASRPADANVKAMLVRAM